MTSNKPVFLNHMALINALGFDQKTVFDKLLRADTSGMQSVRTTIIEHDFLAGKVTEQLPAIPDRLAEQNSRNNQLILHCLTQLAAQLDVMMEKYPKNRIGVVIGTSTSGIAEGEVALQQQLQTTKFPDNFHYPQIEMSSPAQFVADYLDISGPAYTVSTACSSSGKVMASARSLIQNGLCDLVIVGGSDSLCEMTLHGFNSLEAISDELSLPFSVNRNGINIGEGAALFLMTSEPSDIELLGVGEASDAHHISAPHPQGEGAAKAMKSALQDSSLNPEDIDYLNLHGTGTQLNDSMEAIAVSTTLPPSTYCSSTKPLTGHTLGAAGATELAFCWLALKQDGTLLPAHCYDDCYDPEIPALNLVNSNSASDRLNITMSNSFAFGGNNVSVIIGRAER